jgi:hypothetical protein
VSSGLWVLAISAALRAARTDLFHRAQAHGLGFRAEPALFYYSRKSSTGATIRRGTPAFPPASSLKPQASERAKPALWVSAKEPAVMEVTCSAFKSGSPIPALEESTGSATPAAAGQSR